MSPAPTAATNAAPTDAVDAYRTAVLRQNELINEGMSNSGRERNCCFLNNGSGRFANISAASGLDHIGDGRAYALTDWDHDGDVDIWATNRTGPRAQFFRNGGVPEHHFVGLRLQGDGVAVNRDAIGARVELLLEGDDQGKRIKTVRAGEGFLAQSSKTLLFGLGTQTKIDRIIVDWPGGEREEFPGVAVDRHYLIVQGSGRLRPWVRPGGAAELIAAEEPTVEQSHLGRYLLRYRIPMPTLEYEQLDGQRERWRLHGGKPTLINLWASWCRPCLQELLDLRDHGEAIAGQGLHILALSVDKLAEDKQSDARRAAAFLKRQKFPFEAGFATDELMSTFDAVHHFLYDVQRQTNVPSSMLFDGQGRLAIIYVGRIDVDQLLSDVEKLSLGDLPWFESSLPYAGTWLNRPPQPDLAALVDSFVERNLADQAQEYFDRFGDVLSHSSRLPDLLVQLGANLGNEGELNAAAERFQEAVAADPENAGAHLELSRAYLYLQEFDAARESAQRAIELRPDFEEAHFLLASLYEHEEQREKVLEHLQALVRLNPDSTKYRMLLGNAHARDGDWAPAIEQFRQAVESAPDRAEPHLQLALALEKSGQTDEAAVEYAQVGRLDPGQLKRQFMLAVGLADAGKADRAIEHFRLAQRLDPQSPFTKNALAWLLATRVNASQQDLDEALQLAQEAAEATKFSHPQLLDTLAAVFAANGQYDKAVAIAQRAIQIAQRAGNAEVVAKIKSRLTLYRDDQPYHLPANEQN